MDDTDQLASSHGSALALLVYVQPVYLWHVTAPKCNKCQSCKFVTINNFKSVIFRFQLEPILSEEPPAEYTRLQEQEDQQADDPVTYDIVALPSEV